MKPSRPALLFAVLTLGTVLCAQAPIGDLSSSDATVKGAVTMVAGSPHVMSGSSITTGDLASSLRLTRGGEVRVCPRSTLSVTASQSGNELMLAMGTGSIETHYRLANSADTILTPDFRLVLAGPGDFHFAVSSDVRGNTCVRALPANTSSIIVYEQMGDGVYQVRPGDQVLFHDGSVKDPDPFAPPDCGCPTAPTSVVVESKPPVPPLPPPPVATPPDATAPPPASDNPVHVQVDAPFVFRGDEPQAPPAPVLARLEAKPLPPALVKLPPVLPPPAPVVAAAQPPVVVAKPKQKKGFFGHMRSFFASIFR